MRRSLLLRVFVLALALVAGACSPAVRESVFAPKVPSWSAKKPLDDLKEMPQDAAAYLDKAKADALLVSPEAAKMRTDVYVERLLAPWRCDNPAYALKSAQKALVAYAKRPGYDGAGQARTSAWAEQLAANANLRRAAVPAGKSPLNSKGPTGRPAAPAQKTILGRAGNSRPAPMPVANTRRPAILVANSNLRAMPTMEPRFGAPGTPGQGYPFDILQVSSLWAGMPVFVDHVSRDGAWALVESAIAPGWVPTADLAYVDDAFMAQYGKGGFAGVIADRVPLSTGSGLTLDVGVGAVFPATDADPTGVTLLVPVRAGVRADVARVRVTRSQAAPMPYAATPANIAAMANQMMGQPYGWGGLDGKRDCSAATKDVLAPFGLWLPRNSSAQAKSGVFISLAGMTPEEKERIILQQGVPYGSLIWMPGHILLYLGQFQGRPVVFHDVWGLRTLDQNGREGRKVIGKAVVTTLRLGEIYPDVGPERMLINRVQGLTLITAAPARPATGECDLEGGQGEEAGQ